MRSSPLIEYSSTVLLLCLWLGAITTVFSSLIGLFQQDIKKVIAYSTMSQLGMMVIAVGLSSYNVALFHLVNHAFYKALLFLGAGSVIHAVADNQDFRKYGGLRQYLPLTYSVMLIASLSLVAFPFMTGFYSKDFILESAYGTFCYSGTVVYYIAAIGAMFTTLYSVKVLYLTFLTNPNGALVYYKSYNLHTLYMSNPRTIHNLLIEYNKKIIKAAWNTKIAVVSQGLENLNYYITQELEDLDKKDRLNFLSKKISNKGTLDISFNIEPLKFIKILRDNLSLWYWVALNLSRGYSKKHLFSNYVIDSRNKVINALYRYTNEFYLYHSHDMKWMISRALPNKLQAHEADIFMSLPLIILAIFSIFFGYICKDLFIGLGSAFFADNSLFIHSMHEIMLDTEFAVNTIFKLLPLVFTITFTIFAVIISEFLPYIIIYKKFSRLGYNIFCFFNQRFFIELLYNIYITGFILNRLAGQTTRIIDKGSVELLGPFGLEKALITLSRNISNLNTGVITSYALYILIGFILYISLPSLARYDISLILFLLALLTIIKYNNIINYNNSKSVNTVFSVKNSSNTNSFIVLNSSIFQSFLITSSVKFGFIYAAKFKLGGCLVVAMGLGSSLYGIDLSIIDISPIYDVPEIVKPDFVKPTLDRILGTSGFPGGEPNPGDSYTVNIPWVNPTIGIGLAHPLPIIFGLIPSCRIFKVFTGIAVISIVGILVSIFHVIGKIIYLMFNYIKDLLTIKIFNTRGNAADEKRENKRARDREYYRKNKDHINLKRRGKKANNNNNNGGGGGGNNPNSLSNLEFLALIRVIEILLNLLDYLSQTRMALQNRVIYNVPFDLPTQNMVTNLTDYFIFIEQDHPQHLDDYRTIVNGIIDIHNNANNLSYPNYINAIQNIDSLIYIISGILDSIDPNWRFFC